MLITVNPDAVRIFCLIFLTLSGTQRIPPRRMHCIYIKTDALLLNRGALAKLEIFLQLNIVHMLR